MDQNVQINVFLRNEIYSNSEKKHEKKENAQVAGYIVLIY